uniref:(California timema) hypothetical protein n=1 Tax=Timema californicum TaxID=61474 RepID=A0A7R9IV42_TIMCA|nr:unnamed protein product [Timema californicum]
MWKNLIPCLHLRSHLANRQTVSLSMRHSWNVPSAAAWPLWDGT